MTYANQWRKEETKEKVCLTLAEVDAFMTEVLDKKQLEKYFRKEKYHGLFPGSWYSFRHQAFENFFEKTAQARDSYNKVFEEHNCPIFLGGYGVKDQAWVAYTAKVTWNGCLREAEFYRIKDAYTAFQELSMYLSNQAQPRKPIPEMDDQTKAEQHGFDKFSFRKDKKDK